MTKKTLFLSLILLASLTLAALVYVQITKPEPSIPVNTNQNANINQGAEIDTSNWKTYKNEQYGFEFKYPEKIGSVKFVLHESSLQGFYGVGKIFTVVVRPLPWQDYMFAIGLMDKKFTQDEFNKSYHSENELLKTFDLAGYKLNGFYSQSLNSSNYSILLEDNQYNYLILGSGCDKIDTTSQICSSLGYSIQVVDKIISTMKIN